MNKNPDPQFYRIFTKGRSHQIIDQEFSKEQSTIQDSLTEVYQKPEKLDIKERNRISAQESRRRKKDYVKQLEAKVEDLQEQIIKLNKKIENYKVQLGLKEIGEEREMKEVKDTYDLLRNDIEEVVHKETQEEKVNDNFFKLFKHYNSLQGATGSDRVKMIKKAVKFIIENLLPVGISYGLYIMSEFPMTKHKFISTMRMKDTKYKEKLERNEINPVQRIVRECGINYECLKKLNRSIKWNEKLRKRVCKGNSCIHKIVDVRGLIKIRNRLLEDQRLVEKWRLTFVNDSLNPKQLSEYFKCIQKVYSDYECSYFNVYKIPKLGFIRNIKAKDIMEESDIVESENNDEDIGLTCSEFEN